MPLNLSNREQNSGHLFYNRRLRAAITRFSVRMKHDDRKQQAALALSVVFVVLACGWMALLGVMKPAGLTGSSPIVGNRDTGALYAKVDGRLHPALNLTSARLVTGSAAAPAWVKAGEIAKYPTGPLIGIPGIPDDVTVSGDPVSAWAVCDTAAKTGTGGGPTVTAIAGRLAPAGRAEPMRADQAVLAAHRGATYLIWNGKRSRIDTFDRSVTLNLGLDPATTRPVEISTALFDAMPAAEPLVIPPVPEAGSPSRWLAGSVVGRVLQTRDAAGSVSGLYVLLPNGIQKITPFVAELLRTADSHGSAVPQLIAPDALVRIPAVDVLRVDFYPTGKLSFVDTAASPVTCVSWTKGGGDPQAAVVLFTGRGLPTPADLDGHIVDLVRDSRGPDSVEAQQTLVLPGAANFVASTGGGVIADSRESLFWVSPQGVRYGIERDPATLTALAIDPDRAVQAPWPILRTFAAGPAINRADALLARDSIAPAGPGQILPGSERGKAEMSKKGFVRGERAAAPTVAPLRVVIAPPLALPEREPRNIALMIAAPALLVGILGTLVVMYASGVRSLQSGLFPLIGLAGFGTLMFSGRFGRTRRISWGEQEKQRRSYLRGLDTDRDEIARCAQQQRRSQAFVHADPQKLDHVIGGPRMWERRMTDADFLDVRVGIGVQSTADSAVSLQWPEVPVGEELEPVTGRALRDFILEQSRIRGMAKVLSLRSQPGFSFVGQDTAELHALMRSVLCALAVHHSPADLKVMVVTRHPERWSWLVWLPHNQHDDIVDACGPRRLVFASPADLEETLDAELHRKGRGPWAPPIGSSPSTTPSPMDSPAGAGLGPHWVIVDDGTGTPEQWETVTGQKGMAGITMLRLASRIGTGVGFGGEGQRFELREGRLTHRDGFYAVADMLAESTADRYGRAMARWSPANAGELTEADSQGGELLRALGISDPRRLDVDRLWAESRGRGDPRWAMIPVGVRPGGELQHVILRAKDFGGYGFHSVVVGTSGAGKSEYFLSLCNGIALTHSPETFIVIFVDMKFESAAQDLDGLPHVAGSLSNLGNDDRHLAERMRKAVDGEIARRYRLFKDAGARDANEYEEMRLAGRDLEPVPILLVIIDEYLELFHHHPDWIDLVIHIGQEGRGCNVFFTLGGQRLDLSSLSKAKSNIAFRVALRAETAEDSRDVIGSDAALHLPSKENGYALLKVGPRELEQFRCFYVSAPFVVPKKPANDAPIAVSFTRPRSLTWEHQPLSDADNRALAAVEAGDEPDEFLYHADGFKKKKLLDVIRESLAAHPARPPHRIWLPPLEVSEPADSLVQKLRGKPWWVDYGENTGLVFPVGIEDLPEEHSQRVHVIDAETDNVIVVATAQRGKSTTLMTTIVAGALMYRPQRLTFFCVGAALYPVEGIPHVAGVVGLTDAEGVSRTLATVEGLIRSREASFKRHQIDIAEFRERRFGTYGNPGTDPDDRFGDVFLVIDNFADLYEKDSGAGDRVIAIARQGLSYGVHIITSASSWLVGQKQALLNAANARIQLRLSNPDETQMGTGMDHRRAARNTVDRPGFGVTRTGHELLIGLPELRGPSGERIPIREVGAAIADRTGAGKVETLARLPERIPLRDIRTAYRGTDELDIPFALGESALQPIALPARQLPHLLIVGRQGCGKTSALAAIGQSVVAGLTPDRAQLTIIDPKTTLIGRIQGRGVRAYAYTADDIDRTLAELAEILTDRLPPSGLTQEELLGRSNWEGPQHFLLIDDEQELRPGGAVGKQAATAPIWNLIERGREIGLHVIAARLPGNWAGVSAMSPFLQKLTGARTPTLFLDNDPATVKVFGRTSAAQLPPGRGLLVTTEGTIEGVLVGTPD